MFSKILSLAEASGFLKRVNLPSFNLEQIKIGPTGCLLRENLKAEWIYNIVVHKDLTVFLSNDEISDTFDYGKSVCSEKLPFGIAEVLQDKKRAPTGELIKHCGINDEQIDFDVFFMSEKGFNLKCTIFVPPSQSMSLFHQWQRQRRMWWRKFAASPGRYSLTDVKTNGGNSQSVDILAKYPWGSQLVETLTFSEANKSFTDSQLKFKEGKRVFQAHSIVSEIKLSTMFLNAICDSYDEPTYHEKARPLFKLHRKLAPYKISFAVAGSDAATISELNDLSLYLSKQLRTHQISTLLLPSSFKNTLEAQYKQYDQLGVPYTVVLNENTLRNGITQLRSRDTTLKEQVHVTNLVTYVEQLFKNY